MRIPNSYQNYSKEQNIDNQLLIEYTRNKLCGMTTKQL